MIMLMIVLVLLMMTDWYDDVGGTLRLPFLFSVISAQFEGGL